MEKRTLGRTGLDVSILGFGGFHLLEISASDVDLLLNKYLDAGGNYVETAAEYGDGESERKVGPIMAARREDCILATKCHARDAAGATPIIESSLANLQTDHVDILFMHHVQDFSGLDAILAPDGAIRAAEEARDAGKVRFIGISNHGYPELMIEALKRYPFDVIMTGFNYYDRFNFPLIEETLLPLALEKGVGVVGMKAVGDGYLWRSAEMAFRYAWSLPIHVMVAGMNTLEYLDMDLGYAATYSPLSDEERDQWVFDAPELGNYVCRLCDKCLPCPENINIPLVFEMEGRFDRQMWDGVVRNPGDYWLRNSLRFWFGNQDRAVAGYDALPVRADACSDCGDCEPRCPYNLPIVDKLRHVHYKMTNAEVLY
ncbi:MAG: aldo/keto reductase [Chloroflexota bacterium]|nr:aldo/keto reductase [Chloroflexota bacterium]